MSPYTRRSTTSTATSASAETASRGRRLGRAIGGGHRIGMVAIFCPFGLFFEINISLLSLQKQPNTAPNLFQRGVEYGKYDINIYTYI